MVFEEDWSHFICHRSNLERRDAYLCTLILQTPETYAVQFLEILQYALVGAGVGIMIIGSTSYQKPTRNHGSLADENF